MDFMNLYQHPARIYILAFNVIAMVDDILNNAWQNAYDQHPHTLQDLETRLGCCGFSSVGDRAIPKSSKYACRDSPAFGYNVPCQSQLKEAYQINENMLLSVVAAILLLQLMALASMVALWLQLPRNEEIEDRYRADHSERLLRGLQEEDSERARYGTTDNQGR
ncbi:hypothetical protein BGZ58_007952 [Dissophora ornata]|nr:hypothetical protein BGZ58_007952 [Dissophora ornata]